MSKSLAYFSRILHQRLVAAKQLSFGSEEGASLVEMAIVTAVLLTFLIGIVEMSMGMYCYTFAAEAAREASRYAALLGQNSCLTATSPDPNCNLGPVAYGPSKTSYTTSPLQTYVQGLGLPFASQMLVDATWWSPSGSNPEAWTTSCLTTTDT